MRARPFLLLVCLLLLCSSEVWPQTGAEPTVTEFKAQPLYRAASLTWKTKGGRGGELTFQILRSDTFIEGPYAEIGIARSVPSKLSYEFVDKSVGTEAKYYYKLLIRETGEVFGPVPTRPYFSPPATHSLPQVSSG